LQRSGPDADTGCGRGTGCHLSQENAKDPLASWRLRSCLVC
jgi:hypothetical protein